MSAATTRTLTQRQQAVIERIDRRVPIKVIAQELGVSETRVNQHIRALKDIYGAENLNELVEIHRNATGQDMIVGKGLEPDHSMTEMLIRSESTKNAAKEGAVPRAGAGLHSRILMGLIVIFTALVIADLLIRI